MARVPPKAPTQAVTRITRGEIYLVAFDHTVGHEIKKTPPALVSQNNMGNRYSPLTIVAAITSALSPVSYRVEVVVEPTRTNGLSVRSAIRLDQIRTVDRQRLVRRLGRIDRVAFGKVDEAIKISLGLITL